MGRNTKEMREYEMNILEEIQNCSVEWKELGEVSHFYGGLTGKIKSDFENGTAKYVTYKNIFNILSDFQSDILKLLPTNIPEKNEKNKPRYYTYRLYVYDAKRGDTFMLFKYIGECSGR